MPKTPPAIFSHVPRLLICLLLCVAGCDQFSSSAGESANGQGTSEGTQNADAAPSARREAQGKTIISDGQITVRDGEITTGQPQVTEAVEQEIYKALAYRRNMANSLQQRGSNGRGAQQMRDEYELLVKANMTRYGLSRAEIDAILKKGDEQGWK